jgi:hypothetical protein
MSASQLVRDRMAAVSAPPQPHRRPDVHGGRLKGNRRQARIGHGRLGQPDADAEPFVSSCSGTRGKRSSALQSVQSGTLQDVLVHK